MSCNRLRRRVVTVRHDSIVLFLHRLCSLVDLLRSTNPVWMVLTGRALISPCTVCHPTAPSLLSHASRPLGAAQVRVGLKHRRYDEMCVKDGGSFVPLVLETSGALARESKELLRVATKLEVSGLGGDPRALLAHILRCISFLVHRGNARVLLHQAR